MKRKKWSEVEEQTLLSKYSELLNSGSLAKLKTREKKLKPIADHVNSVHHLQEPFRWSWRDLSIKIQNMRHQYLGVKQKIKISDNNFNWSDGQYHWQNFLLYKEVFGDVEISQSRKQIQNINNSRKLVGEEDEMFNDGYGIGSQEIVGNEGEEADMFEDDVGVSGGNRLREEGLEFKGMMIRREEKRREIEWSREEREMGSDQRQKEQKFSKEMDDTKRDEDLEERDTEFECRQIMWAKKEYERRVRLEKEFDEERTRRMNLEEKWEEEEMQWKEMMAGMQSEHEKQMMQLHIDACQNQMQVLGFVARVWCQFYGSLNDGLAPQVMQNLQDVGSLGASNRKPDTNSPSEFL